MSTHLNTDPSGHQPLPESMRPKSAAEFIGQEAIWGQNGRLKRLVESGKFRSGIFWGPPGTGKTTLARVIANQGGFEPRFLSAVSAGVKDLREVFQESEQRLAKDEQPLLLFLDEVHRLSKLQQDSLLPALESGVVWFIGATTENPTFEVNRAVLSRSLVFPFSRLTESELRTMICRAHARLCGSTDRVRPWSEPLIGVVARASDGDGRQCLNLVESIAFAAPSGNGPLDLSDAPEFISGLLRQFDKAGDLHYEVISALIKSIRASEVDAALYYCARLIDAGEDPQFIARRLIISASEDIGNANPTALLVATAGFQAVAATGYPEARIVFAQVVSYLAASPKSNRSYLAMNGALAAVEETGSLPVPMFLRNAPTALMRELGYGNNTSKGTGGNGAKSYLPEPLAGKCFYRPSDIGVEKQLKANLEHLRSSR